MGSLCLETGPPPSHCTDLLQLATSMMAEKRSSKSGFPGNYGAFHESNDFGSGSGKEATSQKAITGGRGWGLMANQNDEVEPLLLAQSEDEQEHLRNTEKTSEVPIPSSPGVKIQIA